MADSTRYTIRTLEDIAIIPTEKLDAFLGDLRSALFLGRSSGKLAEASAKNVNANLMVDCVLTEMDWVEDDRSDNNPEFESKRTVTIPGERMPLVLDGFSTLTGRLRDRSAQTQGRR